MSLTGMILHEDKIADYVVIATWSSNNAKTGDMIQIWILCISEDPVTAQKTGNDSIVCFNCKHRDGSCYVRTYQAPLSVYKAYKKGKYMPLDLQYLKAQMGWKAVRFGAYGEPVLVPLKIVQFIAENSPKGWTGYTHQWLEYNDYKNYFMASVDTPIEYEVANLNGWRTYRVGTDNSTLKGEIECPHYSNKIQCRDCRLCDGLGRHKNGKNIAVVVHGSAGVINAFNRIEVATI